MGSQYCQPSDMSSTGINPFALQDISNANLVAACVQASEIADSYMRGRYALPLSQWGGDVVYRVAQIAVYLAISARGYDPGAGADETIRKNHDDAIEWFKGVQRQSVHPDVTPAVPQPGDAIHDLPQVSTAAQRGWPTSNSSGTPTVG